jgi:RNA polymerase sigma-70 factor (ECF subfamily)
MFWNRSASSSVAENYRRYGPLVFRRALFLLSDEADAWDVVHDVFAKVLDGTAPSELQQPLHYFYRSTTRACLNRLRARGVRVAADPSLRTLLPVVYPSNPEATAQLKRVLADLTERQAQVAVLHFGDGMKQEEIAEVLAISRRTVCRDLEDIRQRMQALLKGESSHV